MIERKDSNFYTQALRELLAKESELETALRRLENSQMPKNKTLRLQHVNKMLSLSRELGEVQDKKVIYLWELEKLMDDVADFDSEEYCECVGYCYEKNIYVSGAGEILYLDTDENGADAIGDPAFDPTALKPLDTLPEAEKTMILNYLDEAESTPLWFKHRND